MCDRQREHWRFIIYIFMKRVLLEHNNVEVLDSLNKINDHINLKLTYKIEYFQNTQF